MNICAEVRYILTGDNNIISEHYFCYFRKEDINVDELYDNWGLVDNSDTFQIYIDKLFWKWYNRTSDFNRSYTFYRFIQDFKWQYDSKLRNVVDKTGIISIEKRNELFSFLENYVVLAKKFSKKVMYSFNEIIKTEYKERQERWGGNFLTNLTQSGQITTTCSTTQFINTSSEINLNNLNNLNNSIRIIGDTIICDNQVYNRNTIGNTTFNITSSTHSNFTFGGVNTLGIIKGGQIDKIKNGIKKYKPDYKKLKTEKKKFRSVLKKSVGALQRFIGLDKVLRFLNGEGFIIEAKRFNYRLSLPNHRSLIEGTKNINHFSIKYDLEILNKENEKICNVCTVFNGSPILDQVLSAYMFLISGEEEEFLKNCNFIRRQDNFYKYFPEFNKVPDIETNVLSIINSVTLDAVKRNLQNEKIRKLSKEFINRHFSYDIVDYLFSTDVSWGEAIDYVAFNLFNIQIFDKYVKQKEISMYLVQRDNITKNIIKKRKRITNAGRNNISKLLWGSNDNLGRKRYKFYRGENCGAVSKRTPILYS